MEEKLKKLLKIINKESSKKKVHNLDNLMLEKLREKGETELADKLAGELTSDFENNSKVKITFKSLTYALSLSFSVLLLFGITALYINFQINKDSEFDYSDIETREQVALSYDKAEENMVNLMAEHTNESGYVALSEKEIDEVADNFVKKIDSQQKTVQEEDKVNIVKKVNKVNTLELEFLQGKRKRGLFVPMEKEFQVLSIYPEEELAEEDYIEITFSHEDFVLEDLLHNLEITPIIDGSFQKDGKVVIFKPESLTPETNYTLSIGQEFSTQSNKALDDSYSFNFITSRFGKSEDKKSDNQDNEEVTQPSQDATSTDEQEETEGEQMDEGKIKFANYQKSVDDEIYFYSKEDEVILDNRDYEENLDLKIYRILNAEPVEEGSWYPAELIDVKDYDLYHNSQLHNILPAEVADVKDYGAMDKELLIEKNNVPDLYEFNIVGSDRGIITDFYLIEILNKGISKNDRFNIIGVVKNERVLELNKVVDKEVTEEGIEDDETIKESDSIEYKVNYYNWIEDTTVNVEDWEKVDFVVHRNYEEKVEDVDAEWYIERVEELEQDELMEKEFIEINQKTGTFSFDKNFLKESECEFILSFKTDNKYFENSWRLKGDVQEVIEQ